MGDVESSPSSTVEASSGDDLDVGIIEVGWNIRVWGLSILDILGVHGDRQSSLIILGLFCNIVNSCSHLTNLGEGVDAVTMSISFQPLMYVLSAEGYAIQSVFPS